jgi:hypothetical protein
MRNLLTYVSDLVMIGLYFCGIGTDAELSYTYEEDM